MIQIGEFNTLKIIKKTPQGFYLSDEKNNEEVLLPNRYLTKYMVINNSISVFIYNDSEDRLIATTLKPFVTLNNFAVLSVKSISKFGAFVDWGLPKDLLIPFSEQLKNHTEGDKVVVMLYLDKFSNRLAGTTKLRPHLNTYDIQILEGDSVNVLVFDISELGAQVIVNNEYLGLIYQNEIFQSIEIGDKLNAYVKKIRNDKKLDISLQQQGYKHINSVAEKILEYLKSNNNYMRLNDNSNPEDIEKTFKISKKVFKKAIGTLYKQKIISIEKDGIHLVHYSSNNKTTTN